MAQVCMEDHDFCSQCALRISRESEMSENKHTPGPWVIGRPPPNGEQTIGDKNGLMVAVATTGYGVNSEANARRIVACVNACAGITTEQLERSKSLDEFMRSMKVIEQQRDDLVEEVEKMTIERCAAEIAEAVDMVGIIGYSDRECLQVAIRALSTGQIKLEELL